MCVRCARGRVLTAVEILGTSSSDRSAVIVRDDVLIEWLGDANALPSMVNPVILFVPHPRLARHLDVRNILRCRISQCRAITTSDGTVRVNWFVAALWIYGDDEYLR